MTMNNAEGIICNAKTGKLHRGWGNAPNCNHSGMRRMPACRPVTIKQVGEAADSKFCGKCFPSGRPVVVLQTKARAPAAVGA